jgi:hypothetical protein
VALKPLTALESVKDFDALPNDAIVSGKVAEILLNLSEWTMRRNPRLPRVQLSAGRFGYRAGDIRAFVRGEPIPPDTS